MEQKYPTVLCSEEAYYKNKGYEVLKVSEFTSRENPRFQFHNITLLATDIDHGQAVVIQYNKSKTCLGQRGKSEAVENIKTVNLTTEILKQMGEMVKELESDNNQKLAASREEKKEVKMTAKAGGTGEV